MSLKHFVAAIALAVGGMGTAQAGIINGGFESGGLSGWGCSPALKSWRLRGATMFPAAAQPARRRSSPTISQRSVAEICPTSVR